MRFHSSVFSKLMISMIIAISFGLFATQNAQAVSINNQGQLSADQTVDDDLIISGDIVTVDGIVNGLVIASGNTVNINGTVNGDLFAFGSDVVIGPQALITGNVFSGARTVKTLGRVDGSFFTGAMSLTLSQKASIARNLFFGGYNFSSSNESSIGRDFYMGGYQAVLDGIVGQNVHIDGGAVQVNGQIEGDANFSLSGSESDTKMMNSIFKSNGFEMPEALPAGLIVAPEAKISGRLTYTSPVQFESAIQSQPAGGIVYQTPVPGSENSSTLAANKSGKTINRSTILNTFWKFVRNFFALAAVGLLLVWLAPKLLQKAASAAQVKPFQSVGVGVLSILIAYPGALIVAFVLIGFAILLALLTMGTLNNIVLGLGLSGIGVVLAFFTTLLKFVSKCIVAYLVGDLLMKQVFPALVKGRSVWAMVIGVFLYALISIIPVIGWILSLVVTLIGLGAIWFGCVVKPIPPVIPQSTPAE